MPFFSPDGQWLGFFADGKLKKIPVAGGSAEVLTEVTATLGASWSSDHTIVLAPYASGLQQVPDAGGAPRPLTRFAAGESLHAWPEWLPGSRAVIFGVSSVSPTSALAVQRIGDSGHRALVRKQGLDGARYVTSGHLAYLQAGSLMAVPFDFERLEVRADVPPVSVLQGVQRLMAADITTEHGFAADKPPELFEGDYLTTAGVYARANYDVSPDGRRFLMLKPTKAIEPVTTINVVLNWSDTLKRLVPSGQ